MSRPAGIVCFFDDRPRSGPCSGPLQRAHWIRQQVLRRELGALHVECPRCGVGPGVPCVHPREGRGNGVPHKQRNLALQAVIWSPFVWSWMCEQHHRRLDHVRDLRVARVELPAGVEEYARERALEWWLEREYGPKEKAA